MTSHLIALCSSFVVHVEIPKRVLPLDAERLIQCIKEVENTDNERIGLFGERSCWQIRRLVWERYSPEPFEWASSNRLKCRAETMRVVRAHLAALRARIAIAGLPDTPFVAALAWGAGETATIAGTATLAKRNYAERVANLYYAGR